MFNVRTQHRLWKCILPKFAIAVVAIATSSLVGCAGGTSSVTPTGVADCGTASQSAYNSRAVRDMVDGSGTWYPSPATQDPALQYDLDGTRGVTYDDSDISGAPSHTGGVGKALYGHASSTCTGQSSIGRTTKSLTYVPTQCWYQERTPGIQDPLSDFFLGCDYVAVDVGGDGYGGFIGGRGGSLGVHIGKPPDGGICANSPLSVGDPLPGNTNNIGVADINAIYNGNKVAGWMYLGDDGHRYLQLNYANQAGYSIGVDLKLLSPGVSSPGGYSAVTLWNGQLPPGSRLNRCWSKGKVLA
jgi:hypothetical protein